ncbi:hypothetical protein [Paenibacillus dendritiformis]
MRNRSARPAAMRLSSAAVHMIYWKEQGGNGLVPVPECIPSRPEKQE